MSTNNPMTQEQLDAIEVRLGCDMSTNEDVSILLAEVERLRALTTVTEDMVERAALVLGNRRHRGIHRGWSGATSAARDGWRDEARAALDAALNPGEGS